jgi:hypothetical protein
MNNTFWLNDPTILLNKNNFLQIWPNNSMEFETKLNAISRLVIIMSILGFFITRNVNIIIIGILTLILLASIYYFRKQQIVKSLVKEGFDNTKITRENLPTILDEEFYKVGKKNPFGNVLLTEINDDPNRKSAPPAFDPQVYEDINKATKKQTQMLYPTIKSTNKQLYGDLYDNYQFDTQMMQRFYSNPNTRVTSDQGAFGQWLYGNMPSAKSSGPDGAFARVQDNQRYIII